VLVGFVTTTVGWVGGVNSKHLLYPLSPVACDMVFPDREQIEDDSERAAMLMHDAKVLGMWAIYHKKHLHLQALAPGEVPEEYIAKWT